jgi:hypothetical protein
MIEEINLEAFLALGLLRFGSFGSSSLAVLPKIHAFKTLDDCAENYRRVVLVGFDKISAFAVHIVDIGCAL